MDGDELLSYIPSVREKIDVDVVQICSIDSTNMAPEYWTMMVDVIEKNYDLYNGFVICHGTDTMAYTSAALSYMIQNTNKPIVVTGAQKPMDLEITDAKTNLMDSIVYAADEGSRGVSIVDRKSVV